MKRVTNILVIVLVIALTASFALAGGKKKEVAEEATVEVEKSLMDYLTPMDRLVGEYYKLVAQIKQKENEIETLEDQLQQLDAVIKYQRSIEQAIQVDEQKKANPEPKED